MKQYSEKLKQSMAAKSVSYTSWLNQTAVSAGSWVSLFKSNLTYTGANPSEEVVETTLPDVFAGSWSNYEKYGYTFIGNKIKTVDVETWDTVSGAWVSSGSFTFIWAGNELTRYEFTGTIMGMDATVATNFFYDNAGDAISDSTVMGFVVGVIPIEAKSAGSITYGTGYELRINSEWNDNLAQYVPTEKDSTTLTIDGKSDVEFNFNWEDPDWAQAERVTYSYNADGTISQAVTEEYDEGEWTEESLDSYAYAGAAGISQELKNRMQAARQQATEKMLFLKGDPALWDNAYNIQGRQSAGKSALQKSSGVFLIKN